MKMKYLWALENAIANRRIENCMVNYNSKQSMKRSITVIACTWDEPQFELFILLQIVNTESINAKSNHSLALAFHWAHWSSLTVHSYLFSCTQIPIPILWFVTEVDRMNAIYHNGWTAFCFPFLHFFRSGLLSFKWLSHCMHSIWKNEYFALVRNRNVIKRNSNYNLFHLFVGIFIVGLMWLRLRFRLRLFDLNNNIRFCSFSYIIYVDRNVFIKYLSARFDACVCNHFHYWFHACDVCLTKSFTDKRMPMLK